MSAHEAMHNFKNGFIYRYSGRVFLFTFLLFFYCEVLIYYIVLLQCTWPVLDSNFEERSIHVDENIKPLRMMLIADPHLLGPKQGHWFDKLRREWQMYRTFQTAMTIHDPDAIAFLGDIFDEGQWSNEEEYSQYVGRFHSLFSVSDNSKVLVVVGNHDIGFHYRLYKNTVQRFEKSFNTSSVQMHALNGNLFVTINSMAMHGDHCTFCAPAEKKLKEVGTFLRCTSKTANKEDHCEKFPAVPQYSRPIVLQHFPMYRASDEVCNEPDAAPLPEKTQPFREKWECLSKDSTNKILSLLNPRAIFTGHTHHGCLVFHPNSIPEWTIPSFSWRNKQNPSFILAVFTPNNFSVTKCYMPQETTVLAIYFFCFLLLVLWILNKRWYFSQKIWKPKGKR